MAAEGRLEPSADAAPHGQRLRELDMCHNFIAAGTTRQLARGARHERAAAPPNLRRCCIGGWRRARAIARGLAANTTLTSIDLGYNGLGAAAAQSGMPPVPPRSSSPATPARSRSPSARSARRCARTATSSTSGSRTTASATRAAAPSSTRRSSAARSPSSTCARTASRSAPSTACRRRSSRGVRWLPALPAALPGLGDADAAQPPQLPRTPLQPQGGAHVTCAQILCQAPWRAAGPSSVRVDLRQNRRSSC